VSHSVANGSQPRPVDEQQVQQSGIRRVESRHLVLFTDLPPSPEIDELPKVFDQAFPQWCEFFGRSPAAGDAWQMHAFLMANRDRFARAGLLPAELPTFRNGFSWNADLWLIEQPAAYYRRHLLLHEGTHGFMNAALGNCGPPWFMEGLAEFLATHSWVDGKLVLGYFPKAREEVDHWGRIKLVREAIAAGRRRTIDELLALEPQTQLDNENYAWCWALATLLNGVPRYHARLHEQIADVRRNDFNGRFRDRFRADWNDLADDWQVFTTNLVYGDDVPRAAIEFAPGSPLLDKRAEVSIAADRLWQSSRVQLQAGKRYRLRASGRYTIAAGPPVWWCEPGGVSIRYHNAHPLGMLLAVVRPDQLSRTSAFIAPAPVGLETVLVPEATGTLYLSVNDSPAELADNRGSVNVEVIEE
jgi:hypothetical protein